MKLGSKHSTEARKKISEAKLGKKHPMFGKTHSMKTKRKMSESHLGKKHSEETIRRMREIKLGKNNAMYGKAGENSPTWRGGLKRSGGYVLVLVSSRPTRYKQRSRIIAERAIERELKYNEVVHHVNEITDDDRNGNLLICSRGYHRWLHCKLRRV